TWAGPRISECWLVMIGSLLIGLSFVSMTFATTAAVYLANVLLSIGNGIMWPSFLSIFAQRSDPSKQGTIMGYGNSTGSLASIFGLILGGILFSRIGPSVFFLGATLLFCITVASVGLVRGGGEN
ncbi:MAG: MFS transporter, partial [Bacteroidota bacterium]